MDNRGRFSEQARDVLILAQNEANNRKHNLIDTDHIILAMVSIQSSVGASKVLRDCGATYDRLSQLVGENPYTTGSQRLDLSRDAKRMLELAAIEMKRQTETQISVEHMLIGMLQMETCAGVELLFQIECDMKRLYTTMDVSIPPRVLRYHQTHAPMQEETFDDEETNEGCLPMMIRLLRSLFRLDS